MAFEGYIKCCANIIQNQGGQHGADGKLGLSQFT